MAESEFKCGWCYKIRKIEFLAGRQQGRCRCVDCDKQRKEAMAARKRRMQHAGV